MPPLAVGLLVWAMLSILLVAAFALGAAIGRRGAWEDRRRAAEVTVRVASERPAAWHN